MVIFRILLSILMMSGFLNAAAFAAEGDVWVSEAWMRPVILLDRPGGAYMTITNKGKEDDKLISVTSPLASHVEIHQHLHENGMMKMIKEAYMPVPAGKQSKAKPGGFHLMIFGLKKKLALGEEFPLTLTFEKAGKIEIMAKVMKRSPASMPH